MPDQVWGTTIKIETEKANPDHSLISGHIAIWVIAIHIEAILDHNTGIDAATTGVVYNDLTQPTDDAATDLTMTLHMGHIMDHPHTEALPVLSPETVVGHIHDYPTYL